MPLKLRCIGLMTPNRRKITIRTSKDDSVVHVCEIRYIMKQSTSWTWRKQVLHKSRLTRALDQRVHPGICLESVNVFVI